jgi:hypothetical protein
MRKPRIKNSAVSRAKPTFEAAEKLLSECVALGLQSDSSLDEPKIRKLFEVFEAGKANRSKPSPIKAKGALLAQSPLRTINSFLLTLPTAKAAELRGIIAIVLEEVRKDLRAGKKPAPEKSLPSALAGPRALRLAALRKKQFPTLQTRFEKHGVSSSVASELADRLESTVRDLQKEFAREAQEG